ILKTKELENKINSLVYKLYKFSDYEINITEGK
ncbi:class I SAM-dependent DNA methyltransferase, partial [Campylobacter coli]|nr:class I SAM-dependent DNA methyltransferase [Campylobacter coli]